MNTQKGFSNLLGFLLIIIVLGGGVYFYLQNNSKSIVPSEDLSELRIQEENSLPAVKETKQISSPEAKDILSLNIPLNIKQDKINNTELRLTHTVPYKHTNLCDMKGDAPMQENFVDYSNTISVYDGDFTQIVQKVFPHSLTTDFVDSNGRPNDFFEKLTVNSKEIYKTSMGVEGCGYYTYIIPFDNKAVVIRKEFIPPFSGNFTEETVNKFRNINGVIKPEEADIIFNNILNQIINKL